MSVEKKKKIQSILDEIASISGKKEREDFAKKCGTSLGMLQQVGYGQRTCSIQLAIGIDKATNGRIQFQKIGPKDIDWTYVLEQLPSRLTKK